MARPALTGVIGGASVRGDLALHLQAGAGFLFEPGPVRFATMLRVHRTSRHYWGLSLELGLGAGWRRQTGGSTYASAGRRSSRAPTARGPQ